MDKIRKEFEKKYYTEYMSYDDRFNRYIINLRKGQSVINIDHIGNAMDTLNCQWVAWQSCYKSRDKEIAELKTACNDYKNMYVEKMAENESRKEVIKLFNDDAGRLQGQIKRLEQDCKNLINTNSNLLNYNAIKSERIDKLKDNLEEIGNQLYVDQDGIGDLNEARRIIKEALEE